MEIDVDGLPARMVSREDRAFLEFADVFGARLWRLFRHLGLPPADAEALAVSCVTDIALKVDRFTNRGPRSFEAWVLKLARVAWIDEWRKREPAQALPHAEEDWHRAIAHCEPNPALSRAVAEALEQLGEPDRTIIRLHHLEQELPFAEIAARVGLKEGTTRVRHLRALRRLEVILRDNPALRAWSDPAPPLVTGQAST